jgi:hypothetical protein
VTDVPKMQIEKLLAGLQVEMTCGSRFICIKSGKGDRFEDYTPIAERPKDLPEELWTSVAEKIIAALEKSR